MTQQQRADEGEAAVLRRVALAQIAPVLGDRQRNIELHLEQIKAAARQQVDLIVFPELSLTGYFRPRHGARRGYRAQFD